jgi:hypothetical protein
MQLTQHNVSDTGRLRRIVAPIQVGELELELKRPRVGASFFGLEDHVPTSRLPRLWHKPAVLNPQRAGSLARPALKPRTSAAVLETHRTDVAFVMGEDARCT